MSEIQKTPNQLYNDYAELYQQRKRDTMINLLECGKILNDVKESLGYGVWCQFLQDSRVSESERTSHRILSIYKNYRHLLEPKYKEKANALSQLGVSHLLELQKLPDRFKKEIEIIKEKDGKEEVEIVKVIDEEKLGDFLEQQVDYQGNQKHVRDLPLNEMKKYIQEAQGVYEPDAEETFDEMSKEYEEQESKINNSNPEVGGFVDEKAKEVLEKRDEVGGALENLSSFISLGTELINQLTSIDLTTIAAITEKKSIELKEKVKKSESIAEGLLIRCQELKEKL